jgi:hypothetical protein
LRFVTFHSHPPRNRLKVMAKFKSQILRTMKTKYLLLGVGALLAAGAFWGGRVAWQIRHQLVSLDVRNMPLAEVLRKVERQTWKKIRAEKNLDARITLHVKNKPLSDVLDRLAEQSGARWSTLYAVYNSPTAVKALDKSLRGDSKIESAGWTKVAPKPPPMDELPPAAAQIVGSKGFAGGPGAAGGQRRMMVMRRGSNGPVTFSSGLDGQLEMWSPEELVMETPLSTRFGEQDLAATAKSAAETAKKVNGKWTTFLAFRKSAMGIGFRPPPVGGPGGLGGPNTGRVASGPGGTNIARGPGGPDGPRFDPIKHNPNDRFARLTPEQRVQRARERAQGGGQIVEQRIERN